MTDLTGQFLLTTIDGRLGWLVGLGQFLIGDSSRYSHAAIVVGDQVVEAMPGGAILTPLAHYTAGPKAAVTVISDLPLTDTQRLAIADAAVSLTGTPYSFADYLALALDHWGLRPRRLRRYIADSGHLICSALVDTCYRRAGISLFTDGRDPGDVTPGDLAGYLIESGARHGTDS